MLLPKYWYRLIIPHNCDSRYINYTLPYQNAKYIAVCLYICTYFNDAIRLDFFFQLESNPRPLNSLPWPLPICLQILFYIFNRFYIFINNKLPDVLNIGNWLFGQLNFIGSRRSQKQNNKNEMYANPAWGGPPPHIHLPLLGLDN